MESINTDLEYAKWLHREINGLAEEEDINELQSPDLNCNNLVNKRSSVIEILSDDSEREGSIVGRSAPHRSRSPIHGVVKNEVTFEHQQAITIKRERTSPNDYYMPLIHTYVDLNNNQEWALVNMESNLQQMFDKIKDQFWQKWLKNIKYTVKWDKTGVISDDSAFKIFESHKEVLVSTSAMVRPRVQLISMLLHVLIHIYLSSISKGKIMINNHDNNFRQIMLFLNKTLNTQISTFHKFLYSPDEAEYAMQWYQCIGVCQSYEPFHGTVRCATVPNESHTFWSNHEEACGGQFFKVFEMTRKSQETGDQAKKYVRNVRYRFPRTRSIVARNKDNLKTTTIQPRELFDLTDDDADAPANIQNLCDVINLDDTEYNEDNSTPSTSTNYTLSFTEQTRFTFAKCPFCEVAIGTNRFESHADNCRGYQQKVLFTLKGAVPFAVKKA